MLPGGAAAGVLPNPAAGLYAWSICTPSKSSFGLDAARPPVFSSSAKIMMFCCKPKFTPLILFLYG